MDDFCWIHRPTVVSVDHFKHTLIHIQFHLPLALHALPPHCVAELDVLSDSLASRSSTAESLPRHRCVHAWVNSLCVWRSSTPRRIGRRALGKISIDPLCQCRSLHLKLGQPIRRLSAVTARGPGRHARSLPTVVTWRACSMRPAARRAAARSHAMRCAASRLQSSSHMFVSRRPSVINPRPARRCASRARRGSAIRFQHHFLKRISGRDSQCPLRLRVHFTYRVRHRRYDSVRLRRALRGREHDHRATQPHPRSVATASECRATNDTPSCRQLWAAASRPAGLRAARGAQASPAVGQSVVSFRRRPERSAQQRAHLSKFLGLLKISLTGLLARSTTSTRSIDSTGTVPVREYRIRRAVGSYYTRQPNY